jgi:hypothetical protein
LADWETTRFILSTNEIMESSYRKWNSIIHDMDQLREDFGLSFTQLVNTGMLGLSARSSSSTSDTPSNNEILVIEDVSFANTLLLGHTAFNLGGFIKTSGGEDKNTVDITIPEVPSSDTEDSLVFIEMWREEIYPGSDIFYNGRYPDTVEEVSDEKFLLRTRWRFRTVKGVDFTTYSDGVLSPNVEVLANDFTGTVNYTSTDEEGLYVADDSGIDVYKNKVYAMPVMKITRVAGEDYLDISNLDLSISPSMSTIKHSGQHSIGESDEISPHDISAVALSDKGVAEGVAPLDTEGLIPFEFLDNVTDITDVIQQDLDNLEIIVNDNHLELSEDVAAVESALNNHIADNTNPHNVTTSQIGAVPTSRLLDSGTGINGGGSLTSDRVLSLDLGYTDSRYTSKSHTSEDNPHNIDISDFFDTIHPVGDIVMRYDDTNPGVLPGWSGSWVRITNRFLLAAGGSYSVGQTGGESSVTLSIGEMPRHRHRIKGNDGGHISYQKTAPHCPSDDAERWVEDLDSMSYEGGDSAHNNMPPFIGVSVWRRTS